MSSESSIIVLWSSNLLVIAVLVLSSPLLQGLEDLGKLSRCQLLLGRLLLLLWREGLLEEIDAECYLASSEVDIFLDTRCFDFSVDLALLLCNDFLNGSPVCTSLALCPEGLVGFECEVPALYMWSVALHVG